MLWRAVNGSGGGGRARLFAYRQSGQGKGRDRLGSGCSPFISQDPHSTSPEPQGDGRPDDKTTA